MTNRDKSPVALVVGLAGLDAALTAALGELDVRVRHEPDSDAGLAALAAGDLSLLVLDARVEGGLELCRRVRQDARTTDLPVLFVGDRDEDVDAALAAGATDSAGPDAGPVTLRQRLRRLLSSAAPRTDTNAEAVDGSRDELTGLPHSRLFEDRLSQALRRAQRTDERVAVLHVDVDRFSAINETLGRELGDRLLQDVARRLGACLRDSDTLARAEEPDDPALARLDGDRFMVVLQGLGSEFEPGAVAARLLQAVARPFEIEDTEVFLSASAGIAVCPDDGTEPRHLRRCAETAVAHAKNQGGNSYMFYSARMNRDAEARLQLATHLHHGLAEDQFELVYQPIFDTQDMRIRSVEALLRWNHPERGLVLPSTFIPLAEETGLILPLGTWVLDRACRQWRSWLDAGIGPIKVAINISARQFLDPEFVATVDAAFERHGVDPVFFQFELTEGVLMSSSSTTRTTTEALHDRGIGLSVDDFGTGYSSLNYLRDFPADALKIDHSFVRGVPEDQESCSLVAAIVALAHKMRLSVVAEGVETEGQLRFLRALDCEQVQGFLLGRPQQPVDIEALLLADASGAGGRNVVAFRRRAAS